MASIFDLYDVLLLAFYENRIGSVLAEGLDGRKAVQYNVEINNFHVQLY